MNVNSFNNFLICTGNKFKIGWNFRIGIVFGSKVSMIVHSSLILRAILSYLLSFLKARTEVSSHQPNSKIMVQFFCHCWTGSFMLSARLRAPFPRGEGGGYSGFQVTGIIEWGQKSKPKKSLELPTKREKILGPKFNPQKIPCWISEP